MLTAEEVAATTKRHIDRAAKAKQAEAIDKLVTRKMHVTAATMFVAAILMVSWTPLGIAIDYGAPWWVWTFAMSWGLGVCGFIINAAAKKKLKPEDE